MKDLLTKEQRAEVERIRERWAEMHFSEGSATLIDRAEEIYYDLHKILAILDDAQKRFNAHSTLSEAVQSVQRQYTEAELREAFEDAENRDPVHDSEVERLPSGEYKDRIVEVAWYNYCRCARHFGLIKSENEAS